MRVGILGAGDMAEGLGGGWVRAGHEVLVSGRSPARPEALAERIGARAGTFSDATKFGEVVLLAVPFDAATSVLEAANPGGVLIDCTNAIVPGRWTLAAPASERIAAAAPDADVVKAFNLCHQSVWRRRPLVFDGLALGVPLCGSPAAVAAVAPLVTCLGATPVDAGDRAALLDATAAFMIGLWQTGADARAVLPPVA